MKYTKAMQISMMNWTPAKVGGHWTSGQWTISTRVTFENGKMNLTYPKSGYVLYGPSGEVGIYKTLKAAQLAALKPVHMGRMVVDDTDPMLALTNGL